MISKDAHNLIGLGCFIYGYKLLSVSNGTKFPEIHHEPSGIRMALLVLHTLVFGIEIGFKFVTRGVIYLAFPCHFVSFLWIIILASPSNKFNLFLYRCTLHFTHGTLAALLFPVDHDMHLPFERETYWIQHLILLILPIYMICCEEKSFPLFRKDTLKSQSFCSTCGFPF